MTLEAVVLTPFAVIYMIYDYMSGSSVALTSGMSTFWLYVGSAPVTLAPLIFFALAYQSNQFNYGWINAIY